MTKILNYILLFATLTWVFASCKDDKDEESKRSDSVRISAFSLAKDTTVLENLNNVFFTIDLEKGLIYNADSLPKGTNVSELAINITTEDTLASVNIITLDSTYNYRNNRKKKIDLTFPVQAEVTSISGQYKQTYQIKVNVHNTDPDRLVWGGMQYSSLPGKGELTAQKTIQHAGLVYCYMQRNDAYYLATAITPANEWLIREITLPFTPDLQTLKTNGNEMYMLDTAGNLYTTTDGETWEATGENYAALIGCIGENLLTLTLIDGTYHHDIYPRPAQYTPTPVRSDFPVSGFSDMLTYNSSWLTSPQGMIIGGRTADGTLTGAMWGYDGTTWAMLSNAIPAREGASFFPYVTFYVDDNWITSEKPTWFVIGGHSDNAALRDVWTSNNYGITWQNGGLDLAIPGYILPRGYASVVVCDEPLNSTIDTWQSLETRAMPQGYRCLPMRSVSSVDKVPYIYMFGGTAKDGVIYNQVWRSIINRLRFEPIP